MSLGPLERWSGKELAHVNSFAVVLIIGKKHCCHLYAPSMNYIQYNMILLQHHSPLHNVLPPAKATLTTPTLLEYINNFTQSP